MQHMHTLEDQVAALKTAALHLDEDGLLAFDVFYPKYDLMFKSVGEEIEEMHELSEAGPVSVHEPDAIPPIPVPPHGNPPPIGGDRRPGVSEVIRREPPPTRAVGPNHRDGR